MDDLQKRISASRKAILDQRIPPKTLLGKQLFGSLDAAKAALERRDRQAVQMNLDNITKILMQS